MSRGYGSRRFPAESGEIRAGSHRGSTGTRVARPQHRIWTRTGSSLNGAGWRLVPRQSLEGVSPMTMCARVVSRAARPIVVLAAFVVPIVMAPPAVVPDPESMFTAPPV